jgi:glucosamine 6-phosphate synthetase-like amidotransferase/phosphosugar isomerase protein
MNGREAVDSGELKRQILAAMLEDIHQQGEVVSSEAPRIQDQIDEIIAGYGRRGIERIYLIGCGDSLYAAMAARFAVEEWSGISAELVESLEFRYLAGGLTDASLVVGISVSGQVQRTLDGLEMARERGAFTVGITGTPNSTIHACADGVIDIGVRGREPGPVPGTASYVANLTTLYWLSLALGVDAEHISSDEADGHRQSILAALGQIRAVAERNESSVRRYVNDHRAPQPLVLIGGGPNWATAHFGIAKLLEAALVLGVVQELEEWMHEQYFLTGPDLHTILIGADGVIADRLSATANAAATLGAPLALVLPEGIDLGVEAAAVWRYPSGIPELLSPIVASIPLELLAYSLAVDLERHPFDYDNPTRRLISERTIYQNGESAQTIGRRHQPEAE